MFTIVVDDKNVEVSWGRDPVAGLFVLVVDLDEPIDSPNHVLLDVDRLDDLTEQDVIDYVVEYGIDSVYVANSLLQ